MNHIQQCTGVVTKVRDLSPTAREYTIRPSVPLAFAAGAFVNVFVEHNDTTIRRAFSMSSSDAVDDEFTLTIRLCPDGALTPLMWARDYTGETLRLMGPLGLNTADKMQASRVFLFGFGVGAGVVKALAEHMLARDELTELTIVTGNRSVDEILHKDYFDTLTCDPRVSVVYVVSDPTQTQHPVGFIQDHIGAYDFTNADVYMCGQGVACTTLEERVRATKPARCSFFVEAFH